MPRILLIEDNELNREMLVRRLLRRGFEVSTAVDGLQGVAMARHDRPDLILMDLSLPGIDGWEATRRIKADAATAAVPVIALTAHAMAEHRAQALAAGCDEFDTKPVDLARLLGKMERLLGTPGAPAAAPPEPGSVAVPRPAPAVEASIDLPAVPASLPGFKTELEHVCMQAAVAEAVQAELQVVLDEVCTNVFMNAYAPGSPGRLRLDLRVQAQTLQMDFTDQGPAFDPLAEVSPDLSIPWEARSLGGLGIHLVRRLTDRQSYTRCLPDGNRLTLLRHLS
jgi:two-component system, cell cycle response regulator DivK